MLASLDKHRLTNTDSLPWLLTAIKIARLVHVVTEKQISYLP